MKRILFVLTSHGELGDTGRTTGYWLAEAAYPWQVFHKAGYRVDLASIRGGRPPVDGADLDDPVQRAFLDEPALADTPRLAGVDPTAYDGVLYVGGHGTLWDFPGNPDVAQVGAVTYGKGGVLGAVCHGPAGLLDIHLAGGGHLLAGREVTAFSNAEEREIGLETVVPVLLQDALTERGARHTDNGVFQPRVVVDGRLVTGQNPPSAQGVAEEMVRLLDAT